MKTRSLLKKTSAELALKSDTPTIPHYQLYPLIQTDKIMEAREKAVGECESLKAQVAALRRQVEDAQERSPKMTTLSRMLREQLTAKVVL